MYELGKKFKIKYSKSDNRNYIRRWDERLCIGIIVKLSNQYF